MRGRKTVLFVLIFSLLHLKLKAQVSAFYDFDVKKQPVSSALVELALQLNLNVVFLSGLTQDEESNALNGKYTLTSALETLLKDTSLRATLTNHRTIQIQKVLPLKNIHSPRLPELEESSASEADNKKSVEKKDFSEDIEEIVVVGQMVSDYSLGRTRSSAKTQRDFLDTPKIINALPKALIRDAGVRGPVTATLLASSVNYLERSAGITEELKLRGFAYPSLKINGYGSHAYVAPVDVAFLDDIEIAKGPTSSLFGRMEPGGVINMQLKKPLGNKDRLFLRYGTDDFRRAELDMSWDVNERLATRAIGFYQLNGSVADFTLDNAEGLMLTTDLQFENNKTVNFNYRYESENTLQQFGRPLDGFDKRVDFFVEDDRLELVVPSEQDLRSSLNAERHSFQVSLLDWIIGDWSLDARFEIDTYKATSRVIFPLINDFIIEIDGTVLDTEDATEWIFEDEALLALLIDNSETLTIKTGVVSYEEGDSRTYDTEFWSTEFLLYKNQYLGDVEVEQLYGANFNISKPETLIWQTHDARTNFVAFGEADIFFNRDDPSTNLKDHNVGVFGQWAFDWDEFSALLGVRLDYLHFHATNQGIITRNSFTEPTFSVGMSYKIHNNLSTFFNYSESFSPQFKSEERIVNGDESHPVDLINFPEPARSNQLELGIKGIWLNGQLQGSCAVYDIKKWGITSTTTKQGSQGLECDLVGALNKNWHIAAGVSRLNAKIISSESDDLIGNRPRMTPKNSFTLWLNRDITMVNSWESRIGFGYQYVDERYIDARNIDVIEAYSLLNLNATISYSNKISFSLLMRNALNETYTQGVFNSLPYWTNPGDRRTLEARLDYYF